MAVEKECRLCHNSLPITDFPRRGKGWRSECKLCLREYNNTYQLKYREGKKYKAWRRKYLRKNAKRIKAVQQAYLANPENRKKRREYVKGYSRLRRLEPGYQLSSNISRSMRRSFSSGKGGQWETIVGYTLAELKAHLEAQFAPGMSWANVGDWHIDHRQPVESFDITSYASPGFLDCWALPNLQPLWGADNCSKKNNW